MSPFLGAPEEYLSTDDGSSTPSTLNESFSSSDIAIIGMACRLPGNNNTPEQLWQSILKQQVASSDMPEFRWEPYRRRDPRNKRVLDEVTSKGYYVTGLENFDSSFFGISPKEAMLMDPQQRISLEVAWEALENAGIPPQSLAGSNTACFMGVNSDDYSKLLLEDLPGVEAWMGIGTAYCGIPNRISYLLDLRGPSTAVDAACASSLVAIHHGRQALLMQETDLAIVGGVNAICGPGMNRVLDKAGAISKDGVCRSFDDKANGYGRGEGAAIIILKRYHDAANNNDAILAVLKGSAVGQDGKTNGIMAPNAEAQKAVAYAALGSVDANSIQYVEAHATSTSVGDPVEIGAISEVYGRGRSPAEKCFIGSVKPNVGHLEAGAGAVGFLKAVMALRNGIIPPQANLTLPNRKIEWQQSGLVVPVAAASWPHADGPRRAAVCSYGYGGTVSHAVIEEASPSAALTSETDASEDLLLLISAPQEKRLPLMAAQLCDYMEKQGRHASLSAIATTLATRRGHHEWRVAIPVSSQEDAIKTLKSLSGGSESPGISKGRRGASQGIVWLFSGHGAQWPKMGQDLIMGEPVFRKAIEKIDPIIEAEAGFSAVRSLEQGGNHTSDVVQVLTYVVQAGLIKLLMSKGVQPKAIIGHSVGEIAAAVAAGCLTAEEGAIVVCRRAVLYRSVIGEGSMALLQISMDETTAMLKGRPQLWAAIDTSPTSCVISGALAAVSEFSDLCHGKHIKVAQVKSDIAFHSPLLEHLAEPMFKALVDIPGRKPQIQLYTTAMADPREPALRDGAYWVRNMLSPVLLTPAVKAALDDGFRIFQEISSHPIISHSVNETIMELDFDDCIVVPTLVRQKPSMHSILVGVGHLWTKGANIDWRRCFSGKKWAQGLPNTPWLHKPYWKDIGSAAFHSRSLHDPDSHTLLGRQISFGAHQKSVFITHLSNESRPFPGSHPLHGTEIVPAAVLLNTFFAATGKQVLSDIHLRVPVALGEPRDIQVLIDGDSAEIKSCPIQDGDNGRQSSEKSWVTHTTAKTLDQTSSRDISEQVCMDIAIVQKRIGSKLDASFSIDYLASVGVPEMGFPWTVTDHYGTQSEMIARVDVSPHSQSESEFPWNQVSWAPVFDAATSIASTLFHETPRLRMPARVTRAIIMGRAAAPKIAYIHAVRVKSATNQLGADVTVMDETGKALAIFTNMRFAEIEGSPGLQQGSHGLIHRIAWIPAPMLEEARPLCRVQLVGEPSTSTMKTYTMQLLHRGILFDQQAVREFLDQPNDGSGGEATTVLYVPSAAQNLADIAEVSQTSCLQLVEIVKRIVQENLKVRLYTITKGALDAQGAGGLSQAPLVGLSRIIASEHPDIWGALVDCESDVIPTQALQYAAGSDVIKMEDSIPKTARLRPFKKLASREKQSFAPRSECTYLITGGLGSLGVEVAAHLVERGARRIVLVSRNSLPPRKHWGDVQGRMSVVVQKVQELERQGAAIYSITNDVSQADAATHLSEQLEALQLPSVAGVIHAAGILDDELVVSATEEAFSRVMAPKVNGAMNLHKLFPPGQLDFFILFSSCGQLLGFPGQASYASGNSFLDSLAENRRRAGDNATAFQWTSWKGIGGMGDSAFVEAELENRGIASIIPEEAFIAWEDVGERKTAHCVVTKIRTLSADEDLPHQILQGAVIREAATSDKKLDDLREPADRDEPESKLPAPGPDREAFLTRRICENVASVLQFADGEEVDRGAALSDLGMDSVMTVAFRKSLQQDLKVKVPPTLIWGHPTVSHLVRWYSEQLRDV